MPIHVSGKCQWAPLGRWQTPFTRQVRVLRDQKPGPMRIRSTQRATEKWRSKRQCVEEIQDQVGEGAWCFEVFISCWCWCCMSWLSPSVDADAGYSEYCACMIHHRIAGTSDWFAIPFITVTLAQPRWSKPMWMPNHSRTQSKQEELSNHAAEDEVLNHRIHRGFCPGVSAHTRRR